MEMNEIVDLFERRREKREKTLLGFFERGEPGFLVIQRPRFGVFDDCNTIETIRAHNRQYLEDSVRLEWTDDLPYLEPWMGTGVYANAFGCPYRWREGMSPHVEYRYHKIEEVKDIEYPDWRESEIMNRVLECIDVLKEMTLGRIPIALTDTQSPFDTATLVLDATEFFTACYTEPEIVADFMNKLADLVIEFSRAQADRIGENLVARPGHIMHGMPSLRGISISDDNLAVSSPQINEKVSLPADERIGAALGGVAIHSCGNFTHTMSRLSRYPSIFMVDFAAAPECDPNPNAPSEVREALKGTGIVAKARVGGDPQKYMKYVEELADPELRLVVEIGHSPEDAEENYRRLRDKLSGVYG